MPVSSSLVFPLLEPLPSPRRILQGLSFEISRGRSFFLALSYRRTSRTMISKTRVGQIPLSGGSRKPPASFRSRELAHFKMRVLSRGNDSERARSETDFGFFETLRIHSHRIYCAREKDRVPYLRSLSIARDQSNGPLTGG